MSIQVSPFRAVMVDGLLEYLTTKPAMGMRFIKLSNADSRSDSGMLYSRNSYAPRTRFSCARPSASGFNGSVTSTESSFWQDSTALIGNGGNADRGGQR